MRLLFTKTSRPRRKRRVACLYIHVLWRHRQTPLTKHEYKTRHVCIAHATHLTYSAQLMKIGDSPQSQIRKIAYVPPLAHTRVRGGFRRSPKSRQKSEGIRTPYFFLFPSYFFLILVATVRPVTSRTVCQRSNSAVSRRTQRIIPKPPRWNQAQRFICRS